MSQVILKKLKRFILVLKVGNDSPRLYIKICIFRFLNLVSKNSEFNRMTASNLSIVLAPNLLWNSEATLNGGADSSSLTVNYLKDLPHL